MESSQWEHWTHLFCRKVSFLTTPHGQFLSVGLSSTHLSVLRHWQYLLDISMLETCNLSKLMSYSYGIWNQSILAFTFRYIDDVLSLSNSMFGDFVDRIYPIELQMVGTTSSGISYQLRDIYSICRCCWDVATYTWKVHNGEIELISFVVKFRS
jgi:hypothetical protein